MGQIPRWLLLVAGVAAAVSLVLAFETRQFLVIGLAAAGVAFFALATFFHRPAAAAVRSMFGKKKKRDATPAQPVLRCSFCNKSQYDVRTLIAGPNVQICDECVDICLDILSEKRKDQLRSPAVEGHVDASGRSWPLAGTLLYCGLCRIPTTLDQSLAVPERGIICAGCVGAFEAALAQRNEPS